MQIAIESQLILLLLRNCTDLKYDNLLSFPQITQHLVTCFCLSEIVDCQSVTMFNLSQILRNDLILSWTLKRD